MGNSSSQEQDPNTQGQKQVTGWNTLFAFIGALIAAIVGWLALGSQWGGIPLIGGTFGQIVSAVGEEALAVPTWGSWILRDLIVKPIFIYGPILYLTSFFGLMISMAYGCFPNESGLKMAQKGKFWGIAAKNAIGGPITALIVIVAFEIIMNVIPILKLPVAILYAFGKIFGFIVTIKDPLSFAVMLCHLILLIIFNIIFGGVVTEAAANAEACQLNIDGILRPKAEGFQPNMMTHKPPRKTIHNPHIVENFKLSSDNQMLLPQLNIWNEIQPRADCPNTNNRFYCDPRQQDGIIPQKNP